MKRIIRTLLGTSDLRLAGIDRVWRGVRLGDRRELLIGFALASVAWLQETKPRKELIFRKTLPEGSALVIHHRKRGEPRIQVIKPGASDLVDLDD